MSTLSTMPLSKGAVNRAGHVLRTWRSGQSHGPHFPPLEPDSVEVSRALGLLNTYRGYWEGPPGGALPRVSADLQDLVKPWDEAKVSHRLKRAHRIVNKLVHYPGMELARMEDIGGCRVVLPSLSLLRVLESRLRDEWGDDLKQKRGHDYITEPKDTGYRAIHLVVERDGLMVEIQLRTANQNTWAGLVESHENQTGEMLKRGVGNPMMLETFALLAEALAYVDRDERVPHHLVTRLRAPGRGSGLTDRR